MLLLGLKKLAPKMKAYGKSFTILNAMFPVLFSGGTTVGNTVDPMISIPGILLPAGFAA